MASTPTTTTSSLFKRPSAPPKAYKDLGKSATDLLKKGFPSDDRFDWKVELNNGASSNENGTFTGTLTKKKGAKDEGDLSYKLPLKFAEITGKWDLANNLELKLNRKHLVKGLDVNGELKSGHRGLLADSKIKFGADFKRELLNTSGSLLYKASDKPSVTATASAVIGSPEAAVGFDAEISETAELKTINAAVTFSPSDSLDFFVHWKRENTTSKDKQGPKTSISGSFFHRVSRTSLRNLAVAGDLTYDLTASGPDNVPSLSFGGSYSPDNDSDLKARLNSKGVLGLSLNQKVGQHLSVTASVDVPLTSVEPQFTPALKFVISV